MDVFLKFAEPNQFENIKAIQNKCINHNNKAIYSEEFFCLNGLKVALRNKCVLVAQVDDVVVGFVRFYINKREKRISIYQYAVLEQYRGNGISLDMFEFLRKYYCLDLIVKCPTKIYFNNFYKNHRWFLCGEDNFCNNIWILPFN